MLFFQMSHYGYQEKMPLWIIDELKKQKNIFIIWNFFHELFVDANFGTNIIIKIIQKYINIKI